MGSVRVLNDQLRTLGLPGSESAPSQRRRFKPREEGAGFGQDLPPSRAAPATEKRSKAACRCQSNLGRSNIPCLFGCPLPAGSESAAWWPGQPTRGCTKRYGRAPGGDVVARRDGNALAATAYSAIRAREKADRKTVRKSNPANDWNERNRVLDVGRTSVSSPIADSDFPMTKPAIPQGYRYGSCNCPEWPTSWRPGFRH
jgi:hypothetical protein